MPFLPVEQILVGVLVTSAVSFLFMDANPSLWFYDKLFLTENRLKRVFGGKRIWIVGASEGLGAEIALQLSACEAQLIISARNEGKLKHVASRCSGSVHVVPMDVDCSEDEMNRVVELVGPVDCVILNAGIGQQKLSVNTPKEETERIFRINALAPIHLTQTLLRQPKPPSHFVVTSSILAKFSGPLCSSYGASKQAVHAYFVSLALEQPNLQIDLPCPGPIATGFFGTEISKKELKMGASRCAHLILATMLVGGETWIAQQPTLLFFYLNQFLPGVFNFLYRKLLAPTRLALFQAGLNLYDPASIGKLRQLQKEQRRK
jgi:dehydrogenase/reductase SDR family protein 7B